MTVTGSRVDIAKFRFTVQYSKKQTIQGPYKIRPFPPPRVLKTYNILLHVASEMLIYILVAS
jgi:hypothetical protein